MYQYGVGVLVSVSCCGDAVCALPPAGLRCTPTAAHQAALLHLPPAAQGSLGQTLTCGSSPTGTKNKSHSECIIHYGIYWHILHNLIQCNAVSPSVAVDK